MICSRGEYTSSTRVRVRVTTVRRYNNNNVDNHNNNIDNHNSKPTNNDPTESESESRQSHESRQANTGYNILVSCLHPGGNNFM